VKATGQRKDHIAKEIVTENDLPKKKIVQRRALDLKTAGHGTKEKSVNARQKRKKKARKGAVAHVIRIGMRKRKRESVDTDQEIEIGQQ
jgi:hypothetical protein